MPVSPERSNSLDKDLSNDSNQDLNGEFVYTPQEIKRRNSEPSYKLNQLSDTTQAPVSLDDSSEVGPLSQSDSESVSSNASDDFVVISPQY